MKAPFIIREDRSGLAVLGIELEGVVKFPAHMGEAPTRIIPSAPIFS